MFIPGLVITTPYSEYIFYGKNKNRHTIKIIEELSHPAFNGNHSFQDHGCHIKNNKGNNKYVDDSIPMCFANYFGMQQAVNFFFGSVVKHTMILYRGRFF
jgi:hypothetical protein